MRKVILTEKVRASGRLFELGSLKIYDETVPICMGFDFSNLSAVVGYANRMMLDTQSGEVSMQINLKPGINWDDELAKMYDFTIFADQVEARGSVHLNIQTVTSCRLRAVVLVPLAAMPKRKPERRCKMAITLKTVYCPANCDKPFTAVTRVAAMMKLRAHVKKAHPEYDPKWEEE